MNGCEDVGMLAYQHTHKRSASMTDEGGYPSLQAVFSVFVDSTGSLTIEIHQQQIISA